MKKRILLFAIMLTAISFIAYKNSYTEFVPTSFDGDSYREVEVDDMFYENLEFVLNSYHIKYRVENGKKVYVKRWISDDEEIVLNYTRKALDSEWLNSHREQKLNE